MLLKRCCVALSSRGSITSRLAPLSAYRRWHVQVRVLRCANTWQTQRVRWQGLWDSFATFSVGNGHACQHRSACAKCNDRSVTLQAHRSSTLQGRPRCREQRCCQLRSFCRYSTRLKQLLSLAERPPPRPAVGLPGVVVMARTAVRPADRSAGTAEPLQVTEVETGTTRLPPGRRQDDRQQWWDLEVGSSEDYEVSPPQL